MVIKYVLVIFGTYIQHGQYNKVILLKRCPLNEFFPGVIMIVALVLSSNKPTAIS